MYLLLLDKLWYCYYYYYIWGSSVHDVAKARRNLVKCIPDNDYNLNMTLNEKSNRGVLSSLKKRFECIQRND